MNRKLTLDRAIRIGIVVYKTYLILCVVYTIVIAIVRP